MEEVEVICPGCGYYYLFCQCEVGQLDADTVKELRKHLTKSNMEIGDQVQELVTGLRGVVVAKTTYLNATSKVQVCSNELGPVQEIWFDVGRLRVLEPAAQTSSSGATQG